MIPDFLKRENVKIIPNEMTEACKRYEAHFGDSPSTEPSSLSEKEWVKILNYCIKTNQTTEEVFGMEDDDDIDY